MKPKTKSKTITLPAPLSEVELRKALASRGQRYTRQRAAVYRCLAKQASHPTAETIYREVLQKVPKVSLATVYKALDALVKAGVITKIDFADNAARFDCRLDNHVHARCLLCGKVLDVPGEFSSQPPLDPGVLKGFRISGYRVEFLGFCADCVREKRETQKRAEVRPT